MSFIVRECPGGLFSITGPDEFDQPIGTRDELLDFARCIVEAAAHAPPPQGAIAHQGSGRVRMVDDGQRLSEIAAASGVSRETIVRRWYAGERGALLRRPSLVPKSARRTCSLRIDSGETLRDISDHTGIGISVLRTRWIRGDRGERLRRSTPR